MVLYRLSFRLSTDSTVQVLELPGTSHEHLLQGLRPDSVYLVRITAATRVGLGESSVWTSHKTPKATSVQGTVHPTGIDPGRALRSDSLLLVVFYTFTVWIKMPHRLWT